MKNIYARQLIYTRVEEAFSPTRKSGYQVFYADPNLRQNTIDSIVRKVSDFHPHLAGLKRWQCFFLGENIDVVISQTQTIDSHPEIIDKDSRPNILVAHCLILRWADYQVLRYNPFWFIERFQFISSASEMVARYNQNARVESTASFSILESEYSKFDSSWSDHLYDLALTAFPKFVKSKSTILLYGEHREIYDTLRTIFICVPPSYRENLTFDTYIKGKQVPAGEFWAVGSHEWRAGYGFAINTSTKTFNSKPNPATDLYLLWLERNYRNTLDSVTLAAVQEVADSFNFKTALKEDNITNYSLISFYDVHKQYIWSRVLGIIAQGLGESITSRFRTFIERRLPLDKLITIASTEEFSPNELAQYVREWIVTLSMEASTLTQEEWKAVKKFAVSAGDHVLTYWSAAFTHDEKLASSTAKTLSPDEYDYILELIKRPLSPLSLYIPKYSSQFVSAILKKLEKVGEKEYVEVVERLIDSREIQALKDLSGFVHRLGNKELTQLEKIASRQNLPAEFRSALWKRRSELGRPYTLLDRILKRK